MQSVYNKNDQSIHFYLVYYSLYDKFKAEADVLGNIRKRYFETEKKQKNKIVRKENKIVYKYSYFLDKGKPMKWKKMLGSQLIEKSFSNKDGSYYIITYNKNRKIEKMVYFDKNHNWLKNEYYCDKFLNKEPSFVICPMDDVNKIKVSGIDLESRDKFVEVLCIEDSDANLEELEIINFSTKNFYIRCITNLGDMVYCNEIANKERKKALDDLRLDPIVFNDQKCESLDCKDNFKLELETNGESSGTKSENISVVSIIEALKNMAKSDGGIDSIMNEIKDKINFEVDENRDIGNTVCNDDEIIKKIEDRNIYPLDNSDRPSTAYEYRNLYNYNKSIDLLNDIDEKIEDNVVSSESSNLDDSTLIKSLDHVNDKPNEIIDENDCAYQENEVVYVGNRDKGKKDGVGICYTLKNNRIFVANWKDDFIVGKVTEFDSLGRLIYTGYLKDLMRNGFGIEYDSDGNIIYKGQWKNDMKNGKGTIYTNDGRLIEGIFENNELSSYGCEYNSKGFKTYEGQWKNGLYNGQGCKYFENGNYCKGNFVNGEPKGIMLGYTKNGNLVYKGEWKDYEYSGQGEYYVAGEMVYKGEFLNNCYHGLGRRYKDGNCIFKGIFDHNIRSGFGVSYQNGKVEYVGQWKNNEYDGCGILYKDGELSFIGEFSCGKMNGRVNEIVDNKIFSEALYDMGNKIYVKEYRLTQGTLSYQGYVKDGKKNGTGCTYNIYGDKICEGYFDNDRFIKSMEIKKIYIDPLPECEEMDGTVYSQYMSVEDFILDADMLGGTYSGMLKDGKPNGKGTIIYSDHSYMGEFVDGHPCGEGTIYELNGKKYSGVFSIELCDGFEKIDYADDIKYYFKNIN